MTDDTRDNLPFPRRWIAYIAIKLVVLVVLVGVALKYYGLW
jgi:hypothetical protein